MDDGFDIALVVRSVSTGEPAAEDQDKDRCRAAGASPVVHGHAPQRPRGSRCPVRGDHPCGARSSHMLVIDSAWTQASPPPIAICDQSTSTGDDCWRDYPEEIPSIYPGSVGPVHSLGDWDGGAVWSPSGSMSFLGRLEGAKC